MRRIIAFLTLFAVFLSASACRKNEENNITAQSDTLSAAVLVADNNTQSDMYSQLYNGVAAALTVDQITDDAEFSGYDILYLDSSLLDGGFDANKVEEYVKDGGSVFVTNSFIDSFGLDFIGAAQKLQIEGCPVDMTYPEGIGYDRMQELIEDFVSLYRDYSNYELLSRLDYGFGIIPSTAVSIALFNDITLYSMNSYGNGRVFFSNAILPNYFSVQSLKEGEKGEPLSMSTVGSNTLMLSYFAEFVSMQKYGYALERTVGTFATSSASWQLHYEDIEGIEKKSAMIFMGLAQKYKQFPSYTLVRCPYVWFTRSETVTYVLQGKDGLEQDIYEGIYSTGNHMVSLGKWLSLDKYDDTESYFVDSTEYTKRAYPSPCDMNADGKMDIVCGSADGYIYIYYGTGFNPNYELTAATYITDNAGNPINVGSYSSPTTLDFDGDGGTDIITGSEGGTVYFLHNTEGLVYETVGSFETGLLDSMVDSGDLNGDGNLDLVVGSRGGQIYIYYGIGGFMNFADPVVVDTQTPWAAPCITDFDNDGIAEIYFGTYEGYIMKLELSENGVYENTGPIMANTLNMNANFNLKSGSNCVPRFYDIDGDGDLDIISGMLEYGNAVPIDSEYFPCKEELQEQVNYFNENYIYLGIHSYTSEYSTFEHETEELDLQKKAFEKYNISWENKGANQHTWRTSKVGYDYSFTDSSSYNGTYMSQYNSGLLWNSGSQTPMSEAVPQVSAENAIALPFYLFGSTTDMLMLQPCSVPYGDERYAKIGAKYNIPMLFYNHCDHIYRDASEQEEQIKKVDEFVSQYDYCFVGENQLARAAAAAYNTEVAARRDGTSITLEAKTRSDQIPLFDESYQSCTGVRVIFPNEANYSTDASVWRQDGNSLYVSLDKTVRISASKNVESRITAINIPAAVDFDESGAQVVFKDNGMMEVKVSGKATALSSGWSADFDGENTVFVKYGKADTLNIMYE